MHIPTVFPIHHVIWGRFSGWLAPEPTHILRAHYVFIRIWYDPFQCWFDFTCLGHLIVGYSGEGVYCYAAWSVSSHWLLLLARQFFDKQPCFFIQKSDFYSQTIFFLYLRTHLTHALAQFSKLRWVILFHSVIKSHCTCRWSWKTNIGCWSESPCMFYSPVLGSEHMRVGVLI